MKIGLILSLVFFSLSHANKYHVEVSGVDATTKDGKTISSAWKTLAYACERATSVGDTILIGNGRFIETRSSYLNNGMTLLGVDSASTMILGSEKWVLTGPPRDIDTTSTNYIIVGQNKSNIKIANIGFSSADTTKRLYGAIWQWNADGLEINNCFFTEFYWNGICLNRSNNMNIHHNYFLNGANELNPWTGGQIMVRWIGKSIIHHNIITRTKGASYGYKALDGGHRSVKIYNNTIMGHYFAIESAHDDEHDFEIFENEIDGCISIPKDSGGRKTLEPGDKYAVRIHHNLMHDSYGIEGPRNHLIIDSNYVFITRTGGRFYTQHQSSVSNGPMWIRNNVIINLDRGFAWAHGAGATKDFYLYNNTIFCANAEDRTEAILDFPFNSSNWKFMNNIVVAPKDKPRVLIYDDKKTVTFLEATNNAFVNVSNVPTGNWSDVDLGLTMSGNIPMPYYSPKNASSFVVNKGKDVGFPFLGAAPDLGAYEFVNTTSIQQKIPYRNFEQEAYQASQSLLQDILGRRNKISK